MNHEFCIGCGHKAVFQVTKPRFCPSCGVPFNVSLGTAKASRQQEPEEPEFESGGFNIEKLRASITSESESSKRSLDDLWRDPAPRDPNLHRAHSSDPDGKEIIKQTIQDCAPVKAAKEVNG